MQDLRMDLSTRQNSNGTKPSKERVATPTTVRDVQWTLRDKPPPMPYLPFCKGGLESNSHVGKLHSNPTTAKYKPHPYQVMVGRRGGKSAKSGASKA